MVKEKQKFLEKSVLLSFMLKKDEGQWIVSLFDDGTKLNISSENFPSLCLAIEYKLGWELHSIWGQSIFFLI